MLRVALHLTPEPVAVLCAVLPEGDGVGEREHREGRVEVGARPDVDAEPGTGAGGGGRRLGAEEVAQALEEAAVVGAHEGVVGLPVVVRLEDVPVDQPVGREWADRLDAMRA